MRRAIVVLLGCLTAVLLPLAGGVSYAASWGNYFSSSWIPSGIGGVLKAGDNFLAVGGIGDPNNGNRSDNLLISFDRNGMLTSTASFRYNTLYNRNEGLGRIFLADDGGYLVFGDTDSMNNRYTGQSTVFSRLDTNLAVVWSREIPEVVGCSVAKTTDGGYLLIGSDTRTTYGAQFIKIDGQGNIVWQKRYANLSWWMAPSATPDGGFVIGVKKVALGSGQWVAADAATLLKFAGDGALQWARDYTEAERVDIKAIEARTLPDGSIRYLAAGNSISRLYLLELDAGGVILGAQFFDLDQRLANRSVRLENLAATLLTSGDMVLSGGITTTEYTSYYSQTSIKHYLLKIDPQGNLAYGRTIGPLVPINNGKPLFSKAVEQSDGSFLLVGNSTDLYRSVVLAPDDAGNIAGCDSFNVVATLPVNQGVALFAGASLDVASFVEVPSDHAVLELATIPTSAARFLFQSVACAGTVDRDEDGYDGTVDCNDTDPAAHPDALEVPYNSIDENCNGMADNDDIDRDGYARQQDCNDQDASMNPAAYEIFNNGIDENCNGPEDDAVASVMVEETVDTIEALPVETLLPTVTSNGQSAAIVAENRLNTLQASIDEVSTKLATINDSMASTEKLVIYNDCLVDLKAILAKTDGFYGGNPNNDWITTQEGQALLYPPISNAVGFVQGEIALLSL